MVTACAAAYWAWATVATLETMLFLKQSHSNDISILFSSDELLAAGEGGTFDFIYIDANKGNYPTYTMRRVCSCLDQEALLQLTM